MSESEIIRPDLIVSILKKVDRPLTTRELQEETRKLVPNCVASNVIVLNLLRIKGTIKRKREDRKWVWWV